MHVRYYAMYTMKCFTGKYMHVHLLRIVIHEKLCYVKKIYVRMENVHIQVLKT